MPAALGARRHDRSLALSDVQLPKTEIHVISQTFGFLILMMLMRGESFHREVNASGKAI